MFFLYKYDFFCINMILTIIGIIGGCVVFFYVMFYTGKAIDKCCTFFAWSRSEYHQYTYDEEEEYNDVSDSHIINISKHHLKTIFMSSGTKYNKDCTIDGVNISGEVNKIETNFRLSKHPNLKQIIYKIIYIYLKKHRWKTKVILRRILNLNDIKILHILLKQVFERCENTDLYNLLLWFISDMNIKQVDTNQITEVFIDETINTLENGEEKIPENNEEKTSGQKNFKDFKVINNISQGEQNALNNQLRGLVSNENIYISFNDKIKISLTMSDILINDKKLVESVIIYNKTEILNLKKIQPIYSMMLIGQNIEPKDIINIIKSILSELEQAHK